MAAAITIDEARERVLAAVTPLGAETVAIGEALGRVLAEDVDAAADIPALANSAMDGFAVRSGPEGRRLQITGDARAGAPAAIQVGDGEAIRISTGAALPDGADAVLEIELCRIDGGSVVLGTAVEPGRNVRPAGDDVRAGARVAPAGTSLGPAEIGITVVAGRSQLRCASRPRLAILTTGDELVAAGEPLGPGQLHDSNGFTLAALSQQAGAVVVAREVVRDTERATRDAIAGAIAAADVVVLSGGVSVGPHDHVKPALAALGVREHFWRVKLRPGRPTWFGTTEDGTLVFGLPGNPVSSMVTFTLFARPALAALQGAAPRPRGRTRLGEAVARHPDRDECVRVRIAAGVATSTGPQGSHQLSSMVGADALAIVPAGEGELVAGTEVDFEPLA